MISIGNGKVPKRVTTFDSSTIMISSFEEEATIFSRSNAPPPPLISCKLESISSAPSIVDQDFVRRLTKSTEYLAAVPMLPFPLMSGQLELIIPLYTLT